MAGKDEKVECYPDGTPIQRYPKWVNGKIVETKEEHEALLGVEPVKPSTKELTTPKKGAWDK